MYHPKMSIKTPEALIRREIDKKGCISFAQFMNLALYSETGGYYTQRSSKDLSSDFLTSPSTHPALAALLTIQFEHIWQTMDRPTPFYIVEIGAGPNILGNDILRYSSYLSPELSDALTYLSLDRASYQSNHLDMPKDKQQRILTNSIPLKPFKGIILSNELLDSFPFHRVRIEEGTLKEIYVTLQNGKFTECLGDPEVPQLEEYVAKLTNKLEEGQEAEICLAIDPWIQSITEVLNDGIILTIDYGGLDEEIYSSNHKLGNLQCYFRHTESKSPYENIGKQDITTHVDFSSLMRLGKEKNLNNLEFITQRHFLLNLGIRYFMDKLSRDQRNQKTFYSNRMAMEELIRPNGLGGFKVLMQSKNTDNKEILGLQETSLSSLQKEKLARLPQPLLTEYHTDVMSAKYPHNVMNFDYDTLI